MSYFSIAAPQTVPIYTADKDGETPAIVLDFRINAANSALVEIHVKGLPCSDDGETEGTNVLTFNRNGGFVSAQFVPKPVAPDEPAPLAGYKSVDDDAVRNKPDATSLSPVPKGSIA